VPRSTLYDWLRRGRLGAAGDLGYRELYTRVEQARELAEARLLAEVTAVRRGDPWQAAARALELLYPERWARPSDCRRREWPDEPDAA
jgi:hypothetical protein